MWKRLVLLLAVAACGSSSTPATTPKHASDTDPEGPNRAKIAAQIQPLIDGELATGIVVGIIDGAKREIYGFGKGPGNTAPTGATLFELGGVTKVYTGLLLADAVQRKEVALDTPIAELLPPGITAPTHDKQVITLEHLALHSSGLPPVPPSLKPGDNPFGSYTENNLYQDLLHTQLVAPPGDRILYSDYGIGLLAHALGHLIGGGFANAVEVRILAPLGMRDTFFAVPDAARSRLATGTNDDLAPTKPWTYDALAGAGGMISNARDQLKLLEAQLEAGAGSKAPLRRAMQFSQEAQLDRPGDNEGLGWQIDSEGRYWQNGTTGGFYAFLGFDPKAHRGIVILASSRTGLLDSIAIKLYRALANEEVKPPTLPDAAQLAAYAGTYDFQGTPLALTVDGKRLYLQGPDEPKMRMVPISDHEFWLERFQSVVVFEREDGKIKRAIFILGDKQLSATRLD